MTHSIPTARARTARPLPRNIRLRRGGADDDFPTFEVMRRAMGFEMSWQHHAPTRRHLRIASDASFWVAEEGARFGTTKVIGYARSLVRERVWQLTEFFVLPGYHRQGVGSALLGECLADGARVGVDVRLVLASHHPGADALYMRQAGCFPHLPMLLLAGSLDRLRLDARSPVTISDTRQPSVTTGEGAMRLRAEPLLLSLPVQDALDALDRAAVGYARPEEHLLWAREMGGLDGAARLFRLLSASGEPGPIVGYAYLGVHSSGPACALDPTYLPAMLTHLLAASRRAVRPHGDGSLLAPADQYWAVAGTNETMLEWLLQCGWQIVFHYLLMSSRAPGRFEGYVCHNPLYFL